MAISKGQSQVSETALQKKAEKLMQKIQVKKEKKKGKGEAKRKPTDKLTKHPKDSGKKLPVKPPQAKSFKVKYLRNSLLLLKVESIAFIYQSQKTERMYRYLKHSPCWGDIYVTHYVT